MAIRSGWDNQDKTIIRLEFDGDWTWDQFEAVSTQCHRAVSRVSHRVGIICQLTPGTSLPGDRVASAEVSAQLVQTPPNVALMTIVGGDQVVRTLANILCSTTPQVRDRLTLAASLDEARSMITARVNLPTDQLPARSGS